MPPLSVGSILRNRYRISKILFQSKLINVYTVDDIHLFGNMWAVKEMKFLALNNAERKTIIRQFEKEVMKMTELSHPNLARVIDFFVEGQNLYTMREFIPAYDIGTLMSRTSGHIREKDALSWGAQLADVLHYLYDKKFAAVFFRELNLSNILVNSEGVIKLIDLGLATIFQTETDPDRLRVMGSLDYSPPEQFEENPLFDERSLVYSLGAILFHILTRQSPAQTLFNLPPLETLNPSVSSTTIGVIRKATQNDPSRRYQSLSDMKRDLKNALKKLDKPQRYDHPPSVAQQFETREMPLEVPEKAEKRESSGSAINYVLIFIILLLTGGIALLAYKLFFQ